MSAYERLAQGLDDEQLALLAQVESDIRTDERHLVEARLAATEPPPPHTSGALVFLDGLRRHGSAR